MLNKHLLNKWTSKWVNEEKINWTRSCLQVYITLNVNDFKVRHGSSGCGLCGWDLHRHRNWKRKSDLRGKTGVSEAAALRLRLQLCLKQVGDPSFMQARLQLFSVVCTSFRPPGSVLFLPGLSTFHFLLQTVLRNTWVEMSKLTTAENDTKSAFTEGAKETSLWKSFAITEPAFVHFTFLLICLPVFPCVYAVSHFWLPVL